MKAPETMRVGILGGGQLAQMLCLDAHQLGLDPLIYCAKSDDPAAQVARRVKIGRLDDSKGLTEFLSSVDLVILESEFVDCDLLEDAQRGTSVTLAPPLPAIRILQDKLKQKHLLKEIGVATSPLIEKPATVSYAEWIHDLCKPGSVPLVFKWAKLGYDGKGTLIHDNGRDFAERALAFCEDADSRGVTIYAEHKVEFLREVAMVAVRSTAGEFQHYPLVISQQTKGICDFVIGPAKSNGVRPHTEEQATVGARKVAEKTNLIGAFALEFFELPSGDLLVNEIAPRVHNTGHYTQDAAETSQFANHWNAVLGRPMTSTRTRPYFGMCNLLGPPGITLSRSLDKGIPVSDRTKDAGSVKVHWYNKSEIRSGRKLGHINGSATSPEEFKQIWQHVLAIRHRWHQSLAELAQHQKNEES